MNRASIILSLSLMFLLVSGLSARAYTVTYVGESPLYSASVGSGHAETDEDYNAGDLIPFTSHDNFAVVDNTTKPGTTYWFDKTITFTAEDVTSGQNSNDNFQTTWKVTNTGPYTWSDYHFIISSTSGIVTIDSATFITGVNSADFKEAIISTDGLTATFNAVGSGSKLIGPGETLNFDITFDLTDLYPDGGAISVRQIATAGPVPIPPSALLLGSGLLGLGLLGGFRRKTKV